MIVKLLVLAVLERVLKDVGALVEHHAREVVAPLVAHNVLQIVLQPVEILVVEALLNNMIGRSYLITTSFFLL